MMLSLLLWIEARIHRASTRAIVVFKSLAIIGERSKEGSERVPLYLVSRYVPKQTDCVKGNPPVLSFPRKWVEDSPRVYDP